MQNQETNQIHQSGQASTQMADPIVMQPRSAEMLLNCCYIVTQSIKLGLERMSTYISIVANIFKAIKYAAMKRYEYSAVAIIVPFAKAFTISSYSRSILKCKKYPLCFQQHAK